MPFFSYNSNWVSSKMLENNAKKTHITETKLLHRTVCHSNTVYRPNKEIIKYYNFSVYSSLASKKYHYCWNFFSKKGIFAILNKVKSCISNEYQHYILLLSLKCFSFYHFFFITERGKWKDIIILRQLHCTLGSSDAIKTL